MRELAHLPSNTAFVDATPQPDVVCQHIQTVLARTIFRVQPMELPVQANFDGMELCEDTLAQASGLTTMQEAEDWAASHGISPDDNPARL